MTQTKFDIGDRVRHISMGHHGVIVGVDPEHSTAHDAEDLTLNPEVRDGAWYQVTLQDEKGESVDTYLSEAHAFFTAAQQNASMAPPAPLAWNWDNQLPGVAFMLANASQWQNQTVIPQARLACLRCF